MKKRYFVLMCGLALCLAANAQAGVVAYQPHAYHIMYGQGDPVFLDAYTLGVGHVTERCLVGTYASPGKMNVIAAGGGDIEQVVTLPSAGFVHTRPPIEDASGNFVVPVRQPGAIARFASDGTFINSWTCTAIPQYIAGDDGGNIWAALGDGAGMSLVQYNTAGTILQTITNVTLPQRNTIDYVGGLHMYDSMMYVADAGRMIKFDPADPAGTMAEAIAGNDYWGGNFWEVNGMDIGSDGKIYVCQNQAGFKRVRIYDATLPNNANHIQDLSDALLNEVLSGVGVDSAGTVYVAENGGFPNIAKFEVPEPTTMILLGLGSMALLRRKRS